MSHHDMESKSRYQWKFVGSRFFFSNCYDYDIIDTLLDKVIESHNSIYIVKIRLKELNHKSIKSDKFGLYEDVS